MELSLSEALKKGIESHKAGKLQEADSYYTAVLKANSKHPDANHNMGVLAVGLGKVSEALPFFKTALEVNSDIDQFWISYIDALIKLDKLADALAIFNLAKKNGFKGKAFDQLGQKLDRSRDSLQGMSSDKIVNNQEPPKDQFEQVAALYTNGRFQKLLDEAGELLKKYPASVMLYNIQGAANAGLGRIDSAINSYKRALSIKPDLAEIYYNMAVLLKDQRKIEDAIEAYKKALSIKPDLAEAYNNLGILIKGQGKPEEAIEAYNKALNIKPNYAEAYNNLGGVFMDQGKLDKAIEAYKKALSIKPDYAETYHNMGVVLKDQGRLEKAIGAYKKALSIKPDYADAYNNLGILLKDQGMPEEAIEAYKKALTIKPDFAEAYNNMGIALEGATFSKSNKDLQKMIISILDRKTIVRPKDISKAVISLVKHEAKLRKYIEPKHISKIKLTPIETVISDLNELPLLLKLMGVCPLPDLELEAFFTYLRSTILNTLDPKYASPELLRFQSALALQCFTNEYIYNYSKEEEKMLHALEKIVNKAFKNKKQPSPQVILTLASYKALHQYDWCNLLVPTDPIEKVITRQIEEPQKEKGLKSDLPSLESITNKISSEVREQYEDSPYPRWVNLGLNLRPKSISKVVDEIKIKLHDYKIKEIQSPNILIAGCGTGQHSIGTAARFKSSKVLAIDLSLSSLAYAKRKTEELAIDNIEYMQADILGLRKLNRQFDIVESAGVLHHMEDPVAGWKVLIDCLKPGGLMKIGLYSELARQHIRKIRQENLNAGIGSSDAEMRSFRDIVNKSEKDHHKLIVNSPDFYCLSTLKDLLFHVQEHRFTIPKIKKCLLDLRLKFCGFETKKVVSEFKMVNTGSDDPFDLNKWQKFEENNPRAFAGMYQFWCQKVE